MTGPSGYGKHPERPKVDGENKPYIAVTRGMSGFFAVMLWWNPEGGFWEPWTTGIGRYASHEDAEAEARDWATAEGLEFKDV